MMIANGEHLVAAHRATQMAYRVFAGRNDAEAIIGDDVSLKRKTPELSQMHFVLLASDFDDEVPERWKALGDRVLATLSRRNEPVVEAI